LNKTKFSSCCSRILKLTINSNNFIHRFRIYFQQIICCCCRMKPWTSQMKNDSPQGGILLGKQSHSDTMVKSRLCEWKKNLLLFFLKLSLHQNAHVISHSFTAARQKTMSVKWRQSTSETRLYEKRSTLSRRPAFENSLRARQILSKQISHQESLPTASTPLMIKNIHSHLNAINVPDEISCDCIAPSSEPVTNHKFNQTSLQFSKFDVANARSESCWCIYSDSGVSSLGWFERSQCEINNEW
jgi:hypothetical protein